MNTHNTVVQVRSVPRCAKNQDHTHTCDTHFGNTMGLPIPVLNPKGSMHVNWRGVCFARYLEWLGWGETKAWGATHLVVPLFMFASLPPVSLPPSCFPGSPCCCCCYSPSFAHAYPPSCSPCFALSHLPSLMLSPDHPCCCCSFIVIVAAAISPHVHIPTLPPAPLGSHCHIRPPSCLALIAHVAAAASLP